MKTKTFLATVAVLGLAIAQPAAAATRSYESLPAKGVQSADVQRTSAAVAESEATSGENNLWMIFIAVVTGGNKSPG